MSYADREVRSNALRALVGNGLAFSIARAAGGHLGHVLRGRERKALCGFEPSHTKPGSSMVGTDRGHWAGSMGWHWPCRKCEAIIKRLASVPS
jgi:hypothetical protein